MPPQLFWEIRNSSEYLDVECEVLNFKRKECTDMIRNANGTIKSCRIHSRPTLHAMPKIILQQLGDPGGEVVFEDIITYGVNDYSFDFVTVSGVLQEYTSVSGRGRLAVSKDGMTCQLLMEAMINVQLKFVGKVVETMIVNSIKDAYNKIPEVIDRYRERYPEKCDLNMIPADVAQSYTSLSSYSTPPSQQIVFPYHLGSSSHNSRKNINTSRARRRSRASISYTRGQGEDDWYTEQDQIFKDDGVVVTVEEKLPAFDTYTFAETTTTQESKKVDKSRQCTVITTKNIITTVTTIVHESNHLPSKPSTQHRTLVAQDCQTDGDGLLIETSSTDSLDTSLIRGSGCRCKVELPLSCPTYYIATFSVNGHNYSLRERFSSFYNFYISLKKINLAVLYNFQFSPKVWGSRKYSYTVIQHRRASIAELISRVVDSPTCLTLPVVRAFLCLA
eukprot:CFRG3510T1